MEKISVIQEPTKDFPFAVIYKPKALASAPMRAGDEENAFFQAAELFPSLMRVCGKKVVEHGLLHRLDTATDGILLIADSQEFYDYMLCEQNEGRFIKYYKALCQKNINNARLLGGFPDSESLIAAENDFPKIITSYFRPYSKGAKEVRPVTRDSGQAALKKIGKLKEYTTQIISFDGDEAECKIAQGFRHQVRCHLAWVGLPVVNDPLYNVDCLCTAEPLQFTATAIELKNPRNGKILRFSL